LFKCQDIKTGKWLAPPPNGTNIVEIRSTGSQSVLPPSRHPEGDLYQIDDNCPPSETTPKQLERWVNKIAAASILARHYPDEGGRHDFIHAITGGLLQLHWQDDAVIDFTWAILDAVEEIEDDRPQRERTIHNTIKSFHSGGKVYGFKTLLQWVTPEVRDRLNRWLERDARYRVNFSEVPTRVDHGIKQENSIQPWLLEVPGLVGEIAKWAGARSYVKQPLFDLAAGLMSTALLSGNRFVVDVWNTPLQPYFMILAPTACGKESALNSVADFAHRMELADSVFQGFQSYHAMLDQLLKPPNMACWLWDEAGRKLRQAGKSTASPEGQVVTWLLSLYGRANSYSPAFPGRQQTIPRIDHPYLITLAASQPTILVEAITTSDLSTGLINRFILIDAGDNPPEDNFNRVDLFPVKLAESARRFSQVHMNGTFITIPFDSTATYNVFKNFQVESRKRAAMEGSNEMWGRATQNALILAGIISVGVDPLHPQITKPVAEWSVEFSRWSFVQWNNRLGDLGSRSRVEEHSKQVERIIMNPRVYMERFQKRANLVKLLSEGLMPRSVLTRLCRNLTSRELDEVLASLMQAELIAGGDRGDCEVYWSK
jgi:hypothetical protein